MMTLMCPIRETDKAGRSWDCIREPHGGEHDFRPVQPDGAARPDAGGFRVPDAVIAEAAAALHKARCRHPFAGACTGASRSDLAYARAALSPHVVASLAEVLPGGGCEREHAAP
jgi:hypothetical protein